jgi:hypothetical protein
LVIILLVLVKVRPLPKKTSACLITIATETDSSNKNPKFCLVSQYINKYQTKLDEQQKLQSQEIICHNVAMEHIDSNTATIKAKKTELEVRFLQSQLKLKTKKSI